MTQEEKFKEAKRLYETANADQKYVLESLFPELAESEDEMVRKALISFLKSPFVNESITDEKVTPWLAWLEKLGEQKPFDYEKTHIRQNDFAPKSAMEAIKEEKVDNQNCVKPADNVEHKFKVGDEIKTANEEPLTITKIDNEGYWSEDLFICGFDEECIWDLVEQKPAEWTEEDEINLGKAIWYVENPAPMVAKDSMLVEWLKNLRGRVQSQHKQEWNEDDEMMISDISAYLNRYGNYIVGDDEKKAEEVYKAADWLKSLRPHSQWKPSDEQMDALRYVTNFDYGGYKAALVSLYEQLKKLREE